MFAVLIKPKPAQAFLGMGDITFDPTAAINAVKNFIQDKAKWVWDKAKWAVTQGYEKLKIAFDQWQKSESILAKVSYSLMYITVNIMLAKMTQDIVKWIDGGARGSPKIFQDFGEDLANAADLAGGAVIGQLLGIDSKTLCNPDFVKTDLVIAFDKYISPPIFQDKLKCSFTGGLKAWKDFTEDFTKGGWKSWIELSRRENNQLGTFMMTQEELGKSVVAGQNKVKQEIDLGGGFKPQEVCRVTKEMQTVSVEMESLINMAGLTASELLEIQRIERSRTTGTAGTAFTLGAELKDIMSRWNFEPDQLEEFKKFWVENGGQFKCKIQTPAQTIADITSKAITGPFQALNDAAAAALQNIGKNAPSILQPYLNAISASAMNLLIKKEKGLISSALRPTPPRRERRQSSDSFKDANLTLGASQSLLASTLSLRELLMQTALQFSLFTGTLRKISEKKALLWDWPIVLEELNDSGYVWGYIRSWMKTFDANYEATGSPGGAKSNTLLLDLVTSAPSVDAFIASETERVVTANLKENLPNGFPTLPPAGTMNIVANACGAPTQEITPTWSQSAQTNTSAAIGYIAIQNITGGCVTTFEGTFCAVDLKAGDILSLSNASLSDLSAGKNGWFGNVRIIVFDDNGNGAPDRFVRETKTGPTTYDIMTFVDTEQGNNRIKIGAKLSYPIANSYQNEYEDPNIYSSELANFSVLSEQIRSFNGSPVQRIYYTGSAPVLGGDVFVIEGNKQNPAVVLTGPSVPTPTSSFCVDHKYGYRYSKVGTVGTLYAGGNGMSDPSWGGQCGGDEELVATFDWNTLDGEVMVTSTFEGGGCSANTLSIILTDSTTDLTMYETGASCGAGGQQSPYVSNILVTNTNINLLGIPAYYKDSKYLQKFFSPAYTEATAQIENSKRTVFYDDFLRANSAPATIVTLPQSTESSTQGMPYIEHNNLNPYKMKMFSFYEELNEAIDDFMVKIRVILGYTLPGQLKTHLSGLADQIGAMPDDDPTSTSTSDVLTRYNGLSDLYQTLFTGVSSEETLEGLDPNYDILNPAETNIRLALIGQRCPAIPPTAGSSPELIDGCGRFGADLANAETKTTTGEYNMAKRFIFQRNAETGFATNPFTGETSSTLSGILNLDEMTQQLASLPPDKNIIKIIRIRQILEQIQINPQIIRVETKNKKILIDPPRITGVDVAQVSLRNYPEIEAYLNDTTTINKPITDLTRAYGYEDTDAKKAYPIISNDLEEVLPDIVNQISDKLKDVFLKRTELELENAKVDVQERLLDFVYFANDLNPAIQLQTPTDLNFTFTKPQGIPMQLGDVNSKVIRIVASEMTANPVLDSNGNPILDASGNIKYYLPSNNPMPGLGPCMSISGDQIECGTPEFNLRGFDTVAWGELKNQIRIDGSTPNENKIIYIALRRALMAGIRKKIKDMSAMIGIDITSADFQQKISSYILPEPMGSSGAKTIDVDQWDDVIQKGLEDVNVLFTGIFSKDAENPVNNPGDILNFDPSRPITTDIKIKMASLKNDFSLLQKEVEKIIDGFSSGSTADLMSAKSDMEELNQILSTMELNYDGAEACASRSGRGRSSLMAQMMAGGAIIGATIAGPVGAVIGGWIGGIAGALFGGSAKKKAKKKAQNIANKCNAAAFEYNKALLQLTNKFVCGQTWQEPQQ